jgi:hypothetical protein
MSSTPGILLVPALMLSAATTVAAQTVELGGSIATSCQGTDGSFCSDTHNNLRTTGPYGSIWFDDRLEVSGRVVWLKQPDIQGRTFIIEPLEFAITDRSRTLAQGEAIWHFRRGQRARPMFGLGFGRYWDSETVICEPAECLSRLRGASARRDNRVRESISDQSLLVGFSVLLNSRVRLRGGWRYHNPFRDELALSELFIAAGYRLQRD